MRASDFAQPGADPVHWPCAIDNEPLGAKLAYHRYIEARVQMANEAFDLTLGLRPVRRPAPPSVTMNTDNRALARNGREVVHHRRMTKNTF